MISGTTVNTIIDRTFAEADIWIPSLEQWNKDQCRTNKWNIQFAAPIPRRVQYREDLKHHLAYEKYQRVQEAEIS